MWSPTTTSDNKKREELDDCRCSSSAALDAAGGGTGQLQQQNQQQPQQLNVFENNSKKQTSLFGGNLTTTTAGDEAAQIAKKEKELSGASIGAGGEAGDSGFISGPQSQIESQEQATHAQRDHNDGARGGGDDARKFNIPQSKSQQQQQQHQQRKSAEAAEKLVLDSGCIDEDFADDDDNDADYDEQYEVGKVVHQQQQQQQQQQSQVERQQSRATLASIADGEGAGAAGDAAADQMILKHENVIMSGVSERFCNLSLQGAVPRTTSQQLGGMNNLDAAGRRSTAISLNQSTSNKQHNQQAAGNSATQTTAPTTATTTTTTTPQATITPWEQYYQQNDDGDTYLHLACISGYVDVVAALIRMAPHPCLFNIQNDEAQTPLHLAALTAQPKILRMLLIAGANPTLRDRHGNTALHLACISGEEQCVRALTIPISASEIHEAHRQYGHRSNDEAVSYLSCASLPSDMEIRNYDGERCVHLAAQAGNIDILRILVLYGADINAREGKSGRTPLHIAIESCNEDLANFLLDDCQQTLNLETATYAGLTAYQVACALNKSQMQNILEKRGAEPLTPPDSDYDSSDIETDLDDSKLYDRFGDPGYFVSYNGGGNPMTVA